MPYDTIPDLVHAYSDLICRRDLDRWIETWTEDGRWTLFSPTPVQGHEAIRTLCANALDTLEHVIQNVLNGAAELDEQAGTGTGRHYIQEHFERHEGGPGLILAYYDDVYARVDGGWRFASRVLVPLYTGPADLSGAFSAPPSS